MVFTSTKFAVNKRTLNQKIQNRFNQNQPKTVSTSQNVVFVGKYDFSGPKDCFHLNQCLKKTVSIKIFVNIGLPLIVVIVSKKI